MSKLELLQRLRRVPKIITIKITTENLDGKEASQLVEMPFNKLSKADLPGKNTYELKKFKKTILTLNNTKVTYEIISAEDKPVDADKI